VSYDFDNNSDKSLKDSKTKFLSNKIIDTSFDVNNKTNIKIDNLQEGSTQAIFSNQSSDF
jgi:hypothetical protein